MREAPNPEQIRLEMHFAGSVDETGLVYDRSSTDSDVQNEDSLGWVGSIMIDIIISNDLVTPLGLMANYLVACELTHERYWG